MLVAGFSVFTRTVSTIRVPIYRSNSLTKLLALKLLVWPCLVIKLQIYILRAAELRRLSAMPCANKFGNKLVYKSPGPITTTSAVLMASMARQVAWTGGFKNKRLIGVCPF